MWILTSFASLVALFMEKESKEHRDKVIAEGLFATSDLLWDVTLSLPDPKPMFLGSNTIFQTST